MHKYAKIIMSWWILKEQEQDSSKSTLPPQIKNNEVPKQIKGASWGCSQVCQTEVFSQRQGSWSLPPLCPRTGPYLGWQLLASHQQPVKQGWSRSQTSRSHGCSTCFTGLYTVLISIPWVWSTSYTHGTFFHTALFFYIKFLLAVMLLKFGGNYSVGIWALVDPTKNTKIQQETLAQSCWALWIRELLLSSHAYSQSCRTLVCQQICSTWKRRGTMVPWAVLAPFGDASASASVHTHPWPANPKANGESSQTSHDCLWPGLWADGRRKPHNMPPATKQSPWFLFGSSCAFCGVAVAQRSHQTCNRPVSAWSHSARSRAGRQRDVLNGKVDGCIEGGM